MLMRQKKLQVWVNKAKNQAENVMSKQNLLKYLIEVLHSERSKRIWIQIGKWIKKEIDELAEI